MSDHCSVVGVRNLNKIVEYFKERPISQMFKERHTQFDFVLTKCDLFTESKLPFSMINGFLQNGGGLPK